MGRSTVVQPMWLSLENSVEHAHKPLAIVFHPRASTEYPQFFQMICAA